MLPAMTDSLSRLGKYGSIQPIGSQVGTATIDGIAWNLWAGGSSSQYTYSFVAANGPVTSFSGDIKPFFTWYVYR